MNPLQNTYTNAFNRNTNTHIPNANAVNDIQENIPVTGTWFNDDDDDDDDVIDDVIDAVSENFDITATRVPYTDLHEDELRSQLNKFKREIKRLYGNIIEITESFDDAGTAQYQSEFIKRKMRRDNISEEQALALYITELNTMTQNKTDIIKAWNAANKEHDLIYDELYHRMYDTESDEDD